MINLYERNKIYTQIKLKQDTLKSLKIQIKTRCSFNEIQKEYLYNFIDLNLQTLNEEEVLYHKENEKYWNEEKGV